MAALCPEATFTTGSPNRDRASHESEQSPWQTFATFVVSLQSRQEQDHSVRRTVAYFLETDLRETWSDIECDSVYQLIADQLKRNFQLEPEIEGIMKTNPNPEPNLIDNCQPELEPASEPDEMNEELIPEASVTQAESIAEEEAEAESSSDLAAPDSEMEATIQEEESLTLAPTSDLEVPDSEMETTIQEEESLTLAPTSEKHAVQEAFPGSSQDSTLKATADATSKEAILKPLSLKITQLTFFQSPEDEPTQADSELTEAELEEPELDKGSVVNADECTFSKILKKEKPFTVEVTFQVTGTKSEVLIQEPLHYHIRCFIQNRVTRERSASDLTSVGTLTKEKLTYTICLPEIILQQPGLYRMQVITQLDSGRASPDVLEIPLFEVG